MEKLNPDETLRVVLGLAKRMSPAGAQPTPEDAARLAHLVELLDAHLRSGGALPEQWTKSSSAV